MYNFNTVLYQFLETGKSDITFMGRDQELKWLAFNLYPLSFFLYSPFKQENQGYRQIKQENQGNRQIKQENQGYRQIKQEN